MTSPPSTATDPLTDDQLADLAVDLLDAMLSAADVATIGVADWWDRATHALRTGAAAGTCVRTVVTRMADKLQVETLPERAAVEVARIGPLLADPATFARWRRLTERDAVYVAAMCRLRRADRTETRKAAKTMPAAGRAPISEEPMF